MIGGYFGEGDQIGRFRIESIVGHGLLGPYYHARDDQFDRRVVIKTASPMIDDAEEADGVHRQLLNGGRILAQLRHPAIVKAFDVGEVDGLPYLVIEHLEGPTLSNLLHSEQFGFDKLAETVADVAQAIHTAHRRGFLHRNLRPAYVVVDIDGRTRIDGFDIAIHEDELASIERDQLSGFPSYAAPEQITLSAEEIGPHTDVWAMGSLLYRGLTGSTPFGTGDRETIHRAILSSEAERPSSVRPSVPKVLEDICLKCLRKSPNERYASADVLSNDLRQWLRREHATSETPPVVQVFVSHSTQDREFVEREIVGLLERNGIETWYSTADIKSSVQWERTILHGLETSDWFLLVMSPRAAKSEWVKDEVHWAVDELPERIIPVIIEDCNPREFHIRLARIQHVDFRIELEKAREKLLSTLDVR